MLNDLEFAKGMKQYEDSLSEMSLKSDEEMLQEELDREDYFAVMADYANDDKWINERV